MAVAFPVGIDIALMVGSSPATRGLQPARRPVGAPLSSPDVTTANAASHADRLQDVLARRFGFDAFLPLQREAMEAVLGADDSLVVMPTGGGKSLCYQAPALCRPGLTVVISPLISLMQDQVASLRSSGVAAQCLHSGLDPAETAAAHDAVRRGEAKLLYLSPERVVGEGMLRLFREIRVTCFAIDEAHCVSEWGHDFRPEYRQLDILRRHFPGAGLHAYTATATSQVRRDIIAQLGLREPTVLVGAFDRPNLTYRVESPANRRARLAALLDERRGESGIVYCITRREVERVCEGLVAAGHHALPYHGAMDSATRARNQREFAADRAAVIVATVAFGMGIDKPDVRFVIHCGMPKSLEAYQQEAGRAGRDGLPADCILLHSSGDYGAWARLLDRSDGEPTGNAVRQAEKDALSKIYRYCMGVTCRHRALVEHFGQSLDAEACGACDVCLGEIDLEPESTVVSQKILSSVIRTGERFGAIHNALVLRGSESKRIRELGHDRLSTYGLLSDEPDGVVRTWIEQLVAQGCLAQDPEHRSLSVTEAGWQVLRGETTPRLARLARRRRTEREAAGEVSWGGVDMDLFESLRALRRGEAERLSVPSYVVFSDASLREMAARQPRSDAELLAVKGVGEAKLERFGELFLSHIRRHRDERSE